MQSCKAARCQTNGERAPSHLSIKTRETTRIAATIQRNQAAKLHYETLGACHRPKAQGHRNHFGWTIWFKSGVGTTDAIFVIRTLCEKYREGSKPLDMVFVDLEKAYDTVPREAL